jgi:hypothetical protein
MNSQLKSYVTCSYILFVLTFGYWLFICGMFVVMGFGFGFTAILQHLGWMNHKVGDSAWNMFIQFMIGITGIVIFILSIWSARKWEIISFRIFIIGCRQGIKQCDRIGKNLKYKYAT